MPKTTSRTLHFAGGDGREDLTAVLLMPPDALCLLVCAHGAGAGMRHPFLEETSRLLAQRRIATFRFQFPYMEAGRRRPDRPAVLEEAVRRAVVAARRQASTLPILAGGKSMGARMTSRAAGAAALPEVRGLVFLGFPLHPAGKPATERARHLETVDQPMLFVQGTRDRLADPDLLRAVVARLGGRARLHWIEDGDHSFNVRKRSGRSNDAALAEAVDVVAAWARGILA